VFVGDNTNKGEKLCIDYSRLWMEESSICTVDSRLWIEENPNWS
jgi:hypothetical protein